MTETTAAATGTVCPGGSVMCSGATHADRREMTHADRAHLLRRIAHAHTLDRLPAPRSVDMYPEFGYAIVKCDQDDPAAVEAWSELTGATVVHGDFTYNTDAKPWHEYGSRPPGGRAGQLVGWRVDLWCFATGPAPTQAGASS